MAYIIGTAGHIDHGKTSLIKSLTGEDTDRLKEEKERGISIDLGFAHFDLPDGTRAGIVDVPGHERFIRNMLAGAHGIDLVLFTVAADDGVMPQTEEHLDILHLLGIERAAFIITKSDLVPEARVREVEEDILILTAGTSLEGSPAFPFSAITGAGLDRIRAYIIETLQKADQPEARGYFRLPVDRVFILQGHGLIVTGTALSGQVASGDRVRCLPGDQLYRVRSLQVHNEAKETGTRGQRIALNLSGQEKPAIARGDVVCDEKLTRTTDRFDTLLEIRPMAGSGVKNHQRVRVHLGTAERMGKVILLEPREKVGPKESCYCQISLVEPLLTLRRDRFIIRDETARRTLGGGVVLDPWAKKHKRKESGLPEALALLRAGEPASLVEHLIDTGDEAALPIAPIYQFLNLREEEVRLLLSRIDGVRAVGLEGETVYTTARKWQRLTEALLAQLRDFHAGHPLAPGMEMEAARDKLPGAVPARFFRALVERLETDKVIARDGSLIRLPGHTVQLKEDEQHLAGRITALLRQTPLAPPDLKEVERTLGVPRARLLEVVRVLERERSVLRVTNDLYFLREGIDTVKTGLYKHLTEQSDITPAAFRELFGTSRKYTIPLLEYFDREGVTIRVGDARRLRSQRT